jgi:hypothetical protein
MKTSALLGAGWEDDSLEVLWRDAGRAFCSLRRKDAATETHAFIPIPFGAEHPTLEAVNRLTHEHGLQRYLDGSWAVRPLKLVRKRGLTMLVSITQGANPSGEGSTIRPCAPSRPNMSSWAISGGRNTTPFGRHDSTVDPNVSWYVPFRMKQNAGSSWCAVGFAKAAGNVARSA